MARFGRLLVALAVISAMLGGPALAAPASEAGGAQRYIVTFPSSEREPSKLTQRLEAQLGFRADLVYQHAVRGFAGRLTATQVRLLEQRPDVAAIMPDAVMHVSAQTVPTGIERIGTLTNDTASIDGVDNPLPIDVAVIDTGVDTSHPDLNVAGGYNCTNSQTGNYRDGAGHGTHVAGTIAARDNDMGVVGVAPGARVWAVKVFDDSGSGYVSWFVCGVDWVSAHASTIDVANFSGHAELRRRQPTDGRWRPSGHLRAGERRQRAADRGGRQRQHRCLTVAPRCLPGDDRRRRDRRQRWRTRWPRSGHRLRRGRYPSNVQ